MRAVVWCCLCACASASNSPGGDDQPPSDGGITDDGIPVDADPRRGWIDLGSPPGTGATSPAVALWNGAPVVAYSVDQHVVVMTYVNDSTWTPVGTPLRHSSAMNAVTYDPTPVATADGLAVVWPEWSAGAMTSAVRRAASGSWIAPPGAATLGAANAYSFVPRSTAAVDADGAMWIAYAETTDINAPMRIFVTSLLGANVIQRGQSISATSTNTGAIAPTIAIGGDAQFLVWTENGVRVAKRNATTGAWDAFGNSPLTVANRPASNQGNPVISADPSGRPIVAFTSSDGAENGIYVGRWDGAAWSYWGQGLQATPGSVMGATTHPYLADIVAAGDDVAYVTWYEADASGSEGIYVARCTPSGCAQLGRGRLDVAAGAGTMPSLAVDGASRPIVTWVEADTIHVWRYHGDPDI